MAIWRRGEQAGDWSRMSRGRQMARRVLLKELPPECVSRPLPDPREKGECVGGGGEDGASGYAAECLGGDQHRWWRNRKIVGNLVSAARTNAQPCISNTLGPPRGEFSTPSSSLVLSRSPLQAADDNCEFPLCRPWQSMCMSPSHYPVLASPPSLAVTPATLPAAKGWFPIFPSRLSFLRFASSLIHSLPHALHPSPPPIKLNPVNVPI